MKCPICDRETIWKDNPFRPFCSERCRVIDLANWADESYAVPAETAPADDERLERAASEPDGSRVDRGSTG